MSADRIIEENITLSVQEINQIAFDFENTAKKEYTIGGKVYQVSLDEENRTTIKRK